MIKYIKYCVTTIGIIKMVKKVEEKLSLYFVKDKNGEEDLI